MTGIFFYGGRGVDDAGGDANGLTCIYYITLCIWFPLMYLLSRKRR